MFPQYKGMNYVVLFKVPPSISPFTFGNLPMNAGGFALVQCAVTTGDLPLDMSWQYPGDHEVTQRPKVTITRMGDRAAMLVIDVLTADHSGNYTCVATNSAASTSFTAELHINGSLAILPSYFMVLICLIICQELSLLIDFSCFLKSYAYLYLIQIRLLFSLDYI